jgi:RimJ/RimL family protein N-acetyltransferase
MRTERLLLRRWRESDRALFAAVNADPIFREYLQGTIGRKRSDAFVDAIEAHREEHGWGVGRGGGRGRAVRRYVGLWPAGYVTRDPTVEVGWRLARAEWIMYATEAARRQGRFRR